MDVEPSVLPPGTRVHDRYEIEAVLGTGGMATVYLARHIEIGAPLAIKVLHASLAALPAATEHFLNEARAVSRIQHPHVVAVSDYGRLDDGTPFMVMEYLKGEDLESLLVREGPLPWSRVRAAALQLCEALGAAHLQGVIHRDVKPQNCLRQEHSRFGDFVKILDFGIAEIGEEMFRPGVKPIVGTPDFIAPELADGSEPDHRVDIYSLGVTLFVLLTGRFPFEAEDPAEQVRQHLQEEPPRVTDVGPPTLDPRLDALILTAMAKKPSDRFASMAAFAEAIERIEARTPSGRVLLPQLDRPSEEFAIPGSLDSGHTPVEGVPDPVFGVSSDVVDITDEVDPLDGLSDERAITGPRRAVRSWLHHARHAAGRLSARLARYDRRFVLGVGCASLAAAVVAFSLTARRMSEDPTRRTEVTATRSDASGSVSLAATVPAPSSAPPTQPVDPDEHDRMLAGTLDDGLDDPADDELEVGDPDELLDALDALEAETALEDLAADEDPFDVRLVDDLDALPGPRRKPKPRAKPSARPKVAPTGRAAGRPSAASASDDGSDRGSKKPYRGPLRNPYE